MTKLYEIKEHAGKRFICPYCNDFMNVLNSLAAHCRRMHDKRSEQLFIDLFCDGIKPTCHCGCESPLKYGGIMNGYPFKHMRGHDPSVAEKMSKTKKRKHASGELVPWNKGLTCQQSHSWKGGVTSVKGFLRTDKRLASTWKRPKLEKAGFKCSTCGKNKRLEVHHDKETMKEIITKFMKKHDYETKHDSHPELTKLIAVEVVDYHINENISGVVLCNECHHDVHKKERTGKKMKYNTKEHARIAAECSALKQAV